MSKPLGKHAHRQLGPASGPFSPPTPLPLPASPHSPEASPLLLQISREHDATCANSKLARRARASVRSCSHARAHHHARWARARVL